MSQTVVIGGSVAGLATAAVLAELGREVTILERDAGRPPSTVDDAGREWNRPTVPQAHHSHAFGSLGCTLLAKRSPELYAALVDAGAQEIALARPMPPSLGDHTPQAGDEDLVMLGARRSTFELVLRREVLRRPGITLVPGATVRGISTAGGAVSGVRLADGTEVGAELVIDASGRRTALAEWLADAGMTAPTTEVESAEITYYTRHYGMLATAPPGPLNRGFGAGGLWDHYTAVLFLADNGTFSISIGVLPDDQPMKVLRTEQAFTAAVQATPLLAPWLAPDASEPISPVYAMGGLDNSLRPQPGLPGLYAVGDSACTTNPAYGRGVSLALAHAYGLADTLVEHPAIGQVQAAAVAAMTEALYRPWYAEAVQNDRGRAMLWRSTVQGRELPPPPPGILTFGLVAAAASVDAVVWRRLVRVMMTLDSPATVYGDDEIRARVGAALAGGKAVHLPGPSRAELVAAVSG